MGRRDRLVFRRVVPRAARRGCPRADGLRANEARPRRAYGLDARARRRDAERRRSRLRGRTATSARDETLQAPYALAVGAIQERKNQRAALAAAREAGLELVVVGPTKDERVADELRDGGARLEGYVSDGAARRALPRRGVPRPGLAPRGIRAAGGRGDGVGHAGRDGARPGARRGCGRRGGRRPRGRRSPTGSGGRSPSASGSPRPGSSARARSPGRRRADGDGARLRGGARLDDGVSADRRLARARRASWRRCCRCSRRRSTSSSSSPTRPGSVPGRRSRRPCACSRTRARAASPRTSTSAPRRRGRRGSLFANPDVVPDAGAVAALARVRARRASAAASPGRGRCGRTARGSRPVAGSRRCAARSCAGRRSARLFPPLERQRDHYLLDEDVDEPVEADWLLGAFLLMRRAMLDELGGWDEGYRHYVEDIDLCYRAMRAGLGALVRPAARVSRTTGPRSRDRSFLSRHTLWHARSMARFVREHPETLTRL